MQAESLEIWWCKDVQKVWCGFDGWVVVRDVAGPNLDRGFGFKIRTKLNRQSGPSQSYWSWPGLSLNFYFYCFVIVTVIVI